MPENNPSGAPQGDPSQSKPPADPPQGDPPKSDPSKSDPPPQGDSTDWKSEARKWESRAKKDAAELDKLREASKTEDERRLDEVRKQAREEGRTEVLTATNRRLVSAEVRAAAGGKLADPSDAVGMLDLSQFEVADDGGVDQAAVAAAIDKLVESKPYLAASYGRDNDINQGRRNAAGPQQLTRDNLKTMTSDQIEEARNKGQLDNLMKGG